MTTTKQTQQPRLLTPNELSAFVKLYRELQMWSQEQLADLSGLSARTIQRVERGEPSGVDTRRAIARAFDFTDIDALNKPFSIPSESELKEEKEKFDRENITLKALPLITGKQLAKLAETNSMDMSTAGFDMSREAEEIFATLVDYFRDYRDCAELYSEMQKFEVHDELQTHIDALKAISVSLRYATRKVQVCTNSNSDGKPWSTTIMYVVTFPLGEEPEEFATSRAESIKF